MAASSNLVNVHQLHEFADIEYVSKHFELAMPLYKQALELGEHEMSMDMWIDARESLAVCYHHLKRYDHAASYNRTTLGSLDSSPDYGPGHEVTIRIRYNLARALAATSKSNGRLKTKLDEAVSIYKQILSTSAANGDLKTWQKTRQSLASALFKMCRYSEAKHLYEILLCESEAGLQQLTKSECLRLKHEYGGALYHLKEYQKAKRIFLQIQEAVTPLSDAQRRRLAPRLSQSVDRYLAACVEATKDLNLGVARSVAMAARPMKTPSCPTKQNVGSTSSNQYQARAFPVASRADQKYTPSDPHSSDYPNAALGRAKASSSSSRPRREDNRTNTETDDRTLSKAKHVSAAQHARTRSNLTVPSAANVKHRRPKSDQFLDQSNRLQQPGSLIVRPRSAQSSLASAPTFQSKSKTNNSATTATRSAGFCRAASHVSNAESQETANRAKITGVNVVAPYIKPVAPVKPVEKLQLLKPKETSTQNRNQTPNVNKTMPGSWPEETASSTANTSGSVKASSVRSSVSKMRSSKVHTVSSRSNITKPVLSSASWMVQDTGKFFSLPPNAHDTDQWFYQLRRHTHTLLTNGTPKNPGRTLVRVAIIDSGLASARDGVGLPVSRDGLRRINPSHVRYKDFTGGNTSVIDSREDLHGTWCASLLIQTAPSAEVYIANVVNRGIEGQDPGHVAEAIKWAIAEHVDIISMSFGWESEKHEVNLQLDRARNEGILLFAAASNHGHLIRKHGMWPASKQSVYCIYSCRGSGVQSAFNPRPLVGQYNFMFPGEGLTILDARNKPVRGVQEYLGSAPDRRKGTSFATPIAAGTAAMVLDLVRQELRDYEEVERRFKTVEGMSDIFLAMSESDRDSDFCHVTPWKLLGEDKLPSSPHNVNETHKWYTLMAVLKAVRRFGPYPELK